MQGKFLGYYFKHQNGGKTVSFIPGISEDGAFIQVITDKRSYNFNFKSFSMGDVIRIGECEFSRFGIKIILPGIKGTIEYTDITPIKSDIMGVFKYFPMECRHEIVSMKHKLKGSLSIENDNYDFNNGVGYIEGDSGKSFPKKYLWIQANDFDNLSIMLSVAEIPFCGFHFEGCISVIHYDSKEYRLATYLGSKAKIQDSQVVIKQRKYTLIADILQKGTSHALASPINGKMRGVIHEDNNSVIRFRFLEKDNLLFDRTSNYSGYEKFNY